MGDWAIHFQSFTRAIARSHIAVSCVSKELPVTSKRLVSRSRLALAASVLAMAVGLTYARSSAQETGKKAIDIDDYTRWRSISGQEISGDGKWVSYGVSNTNTLPADAKPELHLLKLETSEDTRIPNATGGQFSADSHWYAYQVDPSSGGGRGGRGGRGGGGGNAPAGGNGGGANPPANNGAAGAQGGRGANAAPAAPPRHAELRDLTTGTITQFQDIQSFTFSPASNYLILRHRPAGNGGGGAAGRGGAAAAGGDQAGANGTGAAAAPAGPRGVDVTLRNLATGKNQLLGSVADIAFNRDGNLIAYTIDAAAKDANGVFIFDTRNGKTSTLDNDSKLYNRLAWSEDGAAVAVLRGSDVDKMRERDNQLVVFPNVEGALGDAQTSPVVLDTAKAASFPKDWVISDRAALSWSDDDKRVFFGMKP